MRGPKPKYPVELTTEEEQDLRKLASSRPAEIGKLSYSVLREGSSGTHSSGCPRSSGVEQSADCRGGWL
jgi:hypothetical protein